MTPFPNAARGSILRSARLMLAYAGLLALALAGCAGLPGDGGGAGGTSSASAPQVLPASAEESEERRRARIRLELGASYYQQGNYAVALEELRQTLVIDPQFAALVYMDLGERAKAEESFRRALAIAPNDSELNNNFGWFLCQTGRERSALEHFAVATRNPLYQTPAKPLRNAGLCLMRLGDEKAAEDHFLRAFQTDPRDPVAMYNLAELHLKRRETERARFYAQRLLSSYEPDAQVLWLAFRVERAAGNRDAAASHALQLRRRFPGSVEAQRLASGQLGD